MAAPRAGREEGSMAVGRVEGESMRVEGGKRDCRLVDIRGVWDVPPERMTCDGRVSWGFAKERGGRGGDLLRQCPRYRDRLFVWLLQSYV